MLKHVDYHDSIRLCSSLRPEYRNCIVRFTHKNSDVPVQYLNAVNVDPDPHEPAFILFPGSGFRFIKSIV